MLSKALYVFVIFSLLGLLAGLQTASGQDSNLETSLEEEFYVVISKSAPMMGDMKVLETTLQATPHQACQLRASADTTDREGSKLFFCTNCQFAVPVCGTYQNDWPHRITVDIDQSARYLRVRSWAPWLNFSAGPIWFSCHYLVC